MRWTLRSEIQFGRRSRRLEPNLRLGVCNFVRNAFQPSENQTPKTAPSAGEDCRSGTNSRLSASPAYTRTGSFLPTRRRIPRRRADNRCQKFHDGGRAGSGETENWGRRGNAGNLKRASGREIWARLPTRCNGATSERFALRLRTAWVSRRSAGSQESGTNGKGDWTAGGFGAREFCPHG